MAIRERWKNTRPLDLDTETAVSRVTEVIRRYDSINAAYLFGSRGSAEATPESDLDIAIQTTGSFSWEQTFEVGSELTRAASSPRVDLVWLNRADPVLAFDVIQTGVCIFYRDPDELNEAERLIERRFWDYRLYLRHRDREEPD